MTDDELMIHLRQNTPLNRVRAVLSGVIGRAEQAEQQRVKPTAMETRKAEFRDVRRILDAAVSAGLVEWTGGDL